MQVGLIKMFMNSSHGETFIYVLPQHKIYVYLGCIAYIDTFFLFYLAIMLMYSYLPYKYMWYLVNIMFIIWGTCWTYQRYIIPDLYVLQWKQRLTVHTTLLPESAYSPFHQNTIYSLCLVLRMCDDKGDVCHQLH